MKNHLSLPKVLATLLTIAALFAWQQAFAATKTVTYTLTHSNEGSYQYLGFTISGDTPFDGTSTIQQQLFTNRTTASFTLADGFSIYLSWGNASNVQFYNGNFYSSNYNIYYRVDYGSAFGGNYPYYITDIALTDMSGNTYMPLNNGGTAHTQPNNVQYLQQPYTAALNAYFGKLTITYADAPDLAIFTPHPNGGYCISNVNDLAHLADYVNKGHNDCNGLTFHQTTNITFSTTGVGDTDENYTTIGGYFDGADRNFCGTYDGHGYTISGIRLYKNGTASPSINQGVFGRINTGATIQNVILTDARITGYRYVGGIVGNKVGGTVQDCLVLESTINSLNTYEGALLGKNTGTLTANYYRNCTVNETANATNVGIGNGNSSHDVAGARSMHPLTIQNANVTATGESVSYQNTTYYASNTTITLGYNNLPAGYQVTYSLNGTALSGNTFTMPANDNATVNASTTPITYTITYNLDGGSVATANPTSYNVTTPTFTLNNPTKAGYTFIGWTGTDLTQPTLTVTIAQGSMGDRSYTAHWTPITYNITYNLDGGNATNPTTYTIETPTFTLNNPTKTGYTFAGWTGSNGTTPQTTVTITQGSTGDLSYTAHWTIITYNITYDLGGGSATNPTTYTVETPTFTLNNPIFVGCTFDGWTGTDLTEPTSTVTITQGSIGDRSYTANWTDQWNIAGGADGSETHPYLITTTAGLDLLATEVNNGTNYSGYFFKLGNDIAYDTTALVNGENYTAIGGYYNGSSMAFSGIFDGDGHTISGIRINKTNDNDLGLFGYVDNSTVKNVILSDAVITAYHDVGGIVGYNHGNIENCFVVGSTINGSGLSAGAIIGYQEGTHTVSHNYYNCSVNGATTNVGCGELAILVWIPEEDGGYYEYVTMYGDITDNDGARSVHALTLGEDITATGTVTVTYNGTDYYTAGTEITLAYGGTIPEGYNPAYSVNGNAIVGNTFEMPAADVVVEAVLLERYYIYNSTTGELALLWGAFNKNNKWGSDVPISNVTSVTATSDVSFTGNCYNLFNGFSNCTSMDLSNVNTDALTSTYWMFSYCSGLTTLDLSDWNTANVTNMNSMFNGCWGLQSLNLSDWNTANVTYMNSMFYGCSGLQSLDLSGWNTSIIWDMSDMFNGCSSLTTIYAGEGWNTYDVEYSSYMFGGCTSLVGGMGTEYDEDYTDAEYARIDHGEDEPGYLTGVFALTLADNITASPAAPVTHNSVNYYAAGTAITLSYGGEVPEGYGPVYSMNGTAIEGNTFTMPFEDATVTVDVQLARYTFNSVTGELALIWGEFNKDFNWGDDVPTYEVTSVTATNEVSFTGDCTELFLDFTICESIDLSNVNTDEMTIAYEMFAFCESLETLDLSGWNTSNVIDMALMFIGCESLTSIEGLSDFNTTHVESMYGMFAGCYSFETLDLSGWNTANVTDMSDMFYYCTNLETLDISNWNTSNVEDMSEMFVGCESLTSIEGLSDFNTTHVESMSGMFEECISLETLDLSGWNTNNVEDMALMFYGCTNLTTLNLTGWNTTHVTNMTGLIASCTSLTSIEGLSDFNTTNVTQMYGMFSYCESLETLDLSKWNTANVTDMTIMFMGSSNLTTIYVGEGWSTENVNEYSGNNMFLDCTNLVGGNGTTYDASHIDKEYARIDGGLDNPGYFTGMISLTLAAGWNWWTPLIETSVGALQTALGDKLLLVKSEQGPLTTGNLIPGQLYKIQTSAACSLHFIGTPVTPVSVTFQQGVNWFGYTGADNLPIASALGSFTPALGDKIISQNDGFVLFTDNGWEGTLPHLVPGQGYVYVSTTTMSKTLTMSR